MRGSCFLCTIGFWGLFVWGWVLLVPLGSLFWRPFWACSNTFYLLINKKELKTPTFSNTFYLLIKKKEFKTPTYNKCFQDPCYINSDG